MTNLIDYVADKFGVPSERLFLKDRHRPTVNARQVCMYVMHKYGKVKPMRLITEYFGMDHATIYNAIKSTNNYCDTDRDYRAMVNDIVWAYERGEVYVPISDEYSGSMPEESLIELQRKNLKY